MIGLTVNTFTTLIDQVEGGLINPDILITQQHYDEHVLSPIEDISPFKMAVIVNDLTRYCLFGKPVLRAKPPLEDPKKIERRVKRLENPNTIQRALQRCEVFEKLNKPTLKNIRILTERTVHFLRMQNIILGDYWVDHKKGRLIKDTKLDFISRDCLWDIKISNTPFITENETLRLLVKQILLSEEPTFLDTTLNMGVFNPRLNMSYTIDVEKIPYVAYETIQNYINNDESLIQHSLKAGDVIKVISPIHLRPERYAEILQGSQFAKAYIETLINRPVKALTYTKLTVKIVSINGLLIESEITDHVNGRFKEGEKILSLTGYLWGLNSRAFYSLDYLKSLVANNPAAKAVFDAQNF